MCVHTKVQDAFDVQYFRWHDVNSVNTNGRVTCVAWDPIAPSMLAHGGVDGFVIIWELIPSSMQTKDIRSYTLELNYFMPERRENVKDSRVRDISPLSSIEESNVLSYVHTDSDRLSVHSDSDHLSAHERIHEAAALEEFINAFHLLVDKLGGQEKLVDQLSKALQKVEKVDNVQAAIASLQEQVTILQKEVKEAKESLGDNRQKVEPTRLMLTLEEQHKAALQRQHNSESLILLMMHRLEENMESIQNLIDRSMNAPVRRDP